MVEVATGHPVLSKEAEARMWQERFYEDIAGDAEVLPRGELRDRAAAEFDEARGVWPTPPEEWTEKLMAAIVAGGGVARGRAPLSNKAGPSGGCLRA